MSVPGNLRELRCDICIIGGGPVGLTLADALVRHGRTVVIVESATTTPDPAVAALNAATTSGDPFEALQETRARAIGGTASLWSTIRDGIPGAKYVPLDPIDFEARDVTQWSGWSFGHPVLAPWYDAACSVAEIVPWQAGIEPSDSDQPPRLPFPDDSLTSSPHQWGPANTFTTRLPLALAASPQATLLRGATAVGLEPAATDGDRIDAVRWASLDGTTGTVHAAQVVLAAGTIENTRLLLSLHQETGRTTPHWLGRGFMEHPIDRSLTVVSRHPALSPDPGRYAFEGRGARARLIGTIGLSGKLLGEESLRNASLRLYPVRHRVVARQLRRLSHRLGRTPATTYRVLLDLEQAPHPDNRITLSGQHDAFGRPRAHLHWQWRPDDEAFRLQLLQVIRREFHRCHAGDVHIGSGPPLEPAIHHHAGTTRMHLDPEHGVVDPQLRVHALANLHVAGASVFPTAGVANPTLTILALALRLADQLART